MSGLSMDYYISIFRNNPERLASMKELLLKDFRKMESNFFAYAGRNDLPAMRAELHKAKPIVFNLRFSKMLELIEKYNECGKITDDFMNQLNQEMKHCLAEIYNFLETH